MRGATIFACCAISALGLSLSAAASAALPEVGRCVSKPATGKYKDAGCTEKAGTKASERHFEFLKGAEHVGFTGIGGALTVETEAGSKVECAAHSAAGKYDLDAGVIKEVANVVIKAGGCGLPNFQTCNTPGSAEGQIVTKQLMGPLGFISGKGTKSPVVGLELTAESAGGAFLEVECGPAAKMVVKQGAKKGGNCAIAPITPVNVPSTTAELTYFGSTGTQVPQHFEGSTKICNLESAVNGGPAERTILAFGSTLTSEEALEIKA
jgi:hypothetical protein